MKFAGALKEMIRGLLRFAGYDHETVERMVEGDLKEEPAKLLPGQPSPRFLMQTAGTDWGRETIHPNLWVDLTIGHIKRVLASGRSVVVDDVRFPNELAALEINFGTSFKFVKVIRGPFLPDPKDRYEGLLNGVYADYTINNDSDLDALRKKVIEFAWKVQQQ